MVEGAELVTEDGEFLVLQGVEICVNVEDAELSVIEGRSSEIIVMKGAKSPAIESAEY